MINICFCVLSHIKSFVPFDQGLLIVIFPRVVLYDHRVCSFVAKTGSCLHEEMISVISVMTQQIVLVLKIHIFLLYVGVLDFL